jgi:shikimate dehydrogenase
MRHFGLIGYPLGHSFSGRYFADKFLREGITDACYGLYPIPDLSAFPSFLLSNPLLCGLNVTIPWKEAVIPYLDRTDPVAREIGAVNCIRISGGKLHGFNTDAIGFEQSVLPFLENRFERALILGTGGSSKAIAWVLRSRGIEPWFASRSHTGDRLISYSQLDRHAIAHFRLIINCTPVGMHPREDERPPIAYDGISSDHLLYDLVYNPALTAFLQEGNQRGAQTLNGLRMLELQAEASWKIWNDLVSGY